MTVAGLVLAAGAGRRMGMPKALIRLDPGGPTLVERAVAALAHGGCAHVTVVTGASAGEVRAAADAAGAAAVEARDWDTGMGASLRAGLAALAPSPYAAALVLLVDLPDVGADVVARVLAVGTAEGAVADGLARAAYDGVPGHPVLLGRRHWAAAAGVARGDRGARDLLAGPGVRLIECGDLATGRDADTPFDLPAG